MFAAAVASTFPRFLRMEAPICGIVKVAARGKSLQSRCRSFSSAPSWSTAEPASTTPTSGGAVVRPRQIIICRHGESLGNVDASTYTTTADWRIRLSDRGREQAVDAGRRLRSLLGVGGDPSDVGNGRARTERCLVYCSPYKRARETADLMLSQLPEGTVLGFRSEPRIVEQQFGNFQNYEETLDSRDERVRFGRFFYRFPSGEAGLDVYSRVTSFISTLFRDVEEMRSTPGLNMDETSIVVVTHGLTLRLFLMRWFQISVEEFEQMYNPDNGFLACMERKESKDSLTEWGGRGRQWYELTEESAEHLRIKTRRANPLLSVPP